MDPRRTVTPAVGWLMGLTIVAYFVQLILERMAGDFVRDLFGLGTAAFLRGWVWSFVTYMFLHGGPLHLLLNMLCLYMLGPELERFIGSRRFLVLYFLSGILGGAGWLALMYPDAGTCIGASGAIFGVMAGFATLFPRLPLTIYLFFCIPITMLAWVLVTGLALFQLAMILQPGPTQVAYSAHLAGALAGFGLAWLHRRGFDPGASWRRRRASMRERQEAAQQGEVDRVLDKLAREGLHKLTNAERKLLHEASARLRASRH